MLMLEVSFRVFVGAEVLFLHHERYVLYYTDGLTYIYLDVNMYNYLLYWWASHIPCNVTVLLRQKKSQRDDDSIRFNPNRSYLYIASFSFNFEGTLCKPIIIHILDDNIIFLFCNRWCVTERNLFLYWGGVILILCIFLYVRNKGGIWQFWFFI